MRHGLQGYDGPLATRTPDRRAEPAVVAVVGAGAAGTLTAIHLVAGATEDRRPLHLVLVDPRPQPGRGVAYSTTDTRHLLNVPAGGMSAFPDRPGHLVDWLRAHGSPDAAPADFVPRADYARYLDATLADQLDAAPHVRLEHRCRRVLHARPVPGGVHLALDDGSVLTADAMVLAPGIFAPGTDWAPSALRSSTRFVADPWAPGALDALAAVDGDVLLVGTGLTMVDVALSLDTSRPHPARGLPPWPGAGRAHRPRPSRRPRSPAPSSRTWLPVRRRPTSTTCAPWCGGPSSTRCATPATGGRPSTPCARSPPRSGRGWARTSGPTSSAPTPPGGTCIATGCRPRPPPPWPGCAPPVRCGSAPTRCSTSPRPPTGWPSGSGPVAG